MHQKEFWEDSKVLKRRTPGHPVIEAFARPKVRSIIEAIERDLHTPVTRNMALLDVGSGNGYFSYYLNEHFTVTCLDYSHKILSICPLKNKIQAAAERIPFQDNAFTVTFGANLLHHAEDPKVIINEMLRVCSGYLVLIEPNRMHPLMALFSQISRTDRAILKFSTGYMRSLVQGQTWLISLTTAGNILPNMTPTSLLPILKKMEPLLRPRLYHILIAKKK
jgi:SAM-dependent methyltransferase